MTVPFCNVELGGKGILVEQAAQSDSTDSSVKHGLSHIFEALLYTDSLVKHGISLRCACSACPNRQSTETSSRKPSHRTCGALPPRTWPRAPSASRTRSCHRCLATLLQPPQRDRQHHRSKRSRPSTSYRSHRHTGRAEVLCDPWPPSWPANLAAGPGKPRATSGTT
jgi:hypothetical protein